MSDNISKLEMDNIQKVYNIIKKNSRMSFKSIANEVNLTRQTVSKLFETMEENNMIWGYDGYDTNVFNNHYSISSL